jgi:hypothetical protein
MPAKESSALTWSAIPSQFKHALYATGFVVLGAIAARATSDPIRLFRKSTVAAVRDSVAHVDDLYETAERRMAAHEPEEALLAAGEATGAWDTLRAVVGDDAVAAIGRVDVNAYGDALRARRGQLAQAARRY